MRGKLNGILVIITLLAMLPELAGCAGSAKLNSAWRDWEVMVDGQTHDWQNHFEMIADGKLDVGVLNDGEDLFISVVTTDRELQRRILAEGLVVWLDAAGEKRRSFGIQYPIGFKAAGDIPRDPEAMRRNLQADAASFEHLLDRFESTRDQVVLRSTPGSDGLPMDMKELQGIEVEALVTESRFACELRIPLRSGAGRPWAIGCDAGEDISIGVQCPAIDMQAVRAQMMTRGGPQKGGRAGMGGGRGGMGGGRGGMGRPGGMGASPGGTRPQMPDPIDTWLAVRLTSEPSPAEE